jgi:hypothetical protein
LLGASNETLSKLRVGKMAKMPPLSPEVLGKVKFENSSSANLLRDESWAGSVYANQVRLSPEEISLKIFPHYPPV